MSLQACAELVERGDPDRFLATMAAAPAARAILFPIYAFNLEVARAPWVASEPMIAEMRLQFWRDVAEEIGQGKPARAHEVAEPLAGAVQAEDAPLLDALVAARRWDVYRDAFEDDARFDAYIDATSGNLTWIAARALGASEEAQQAVRDIAWGGGVGAFLRAVPELESRGRVPLLDGRPEGVKALAERALARFRRGRAAQSKISAAARSSLFAFSTTEPLLRSIVADPHRVADGRLGISEFAKKARLLKTSVTGRI
ncbi:squalene/phytoene synthase family protein [Nioella aestuarii]|uniref:squalene/phytoene synthase family protein n=1 Tax=Nioella aestuarii TaxID=1662864 RepID=UPI003D7F9CC6